MKMTMSKYVAEMTALADKLEAAGNHAGAADVRRDIAELSAPRPRRNPILRRMPACRDQQASGRQVRRSRRRLVALQQVRDEQVMMNFLGKLAIVTAAAHVGLYGSFILCGYMSWLFTMTF